MAFSYERYERQQRRATSSRPALTYWVPLVVTVAAATAGAIAWVWNERSKNYGSDEDENDDEYCGDYGHSPQTQTHGQEGYGQAGVGSFGPPPGAYDAPPPASTYTGGTSVPPGAFIPGQVEDEMVFGSSQRTAAPQDEGFVAQMRGAIRRTPSPQKMLEGAGKRVAAGMAVIGKGLTSIGEETRPGEEGYEDHERWSEEVESRHGEEKEMRVKEKQKRNITGSTTIVGGASAVPGASIARKSASSLSVAGGKKKRTVAVVVSAESKDGSYSQDEDFYHIEHASLLSHLIGHVSEKVQVLVLLYAPQLKSHPLSPESKPNDTPVNDPTDAEGNLISSYTSFFPQTNSLYQFLQSQASELTTHPTHILPFTTSTSHVHLLKHLAPNLVYLQESLSGSQGEIVEQIGGWVGQVVVVIGAEGAGLVDTETEDEGVKKEEKGSGEMKWWMDEKRVGLGKGVEVVEGWRLGEDWMKRVESS